MAGRKKVALAVTKDDLPALYAIRDRLAQELDECESSGLVVQLSGQLRSTLAEIRLVKREQAVKPAAPGEDVIAKARAAREARQRAV